MAMRRRRFLGGAVSLLVGGAVARASSAGPTALGAPMPPDSRAAAQTTLFLCGDVMTGRGIDQILAHPSNPRLHEPFVRSALAYVRLAERAGGPIARPVGPDYVWGEALDELDRVRPDARIVNLETAVTTSDDAWPGKGIHYRMHPANVGCLAAARVDCCTLANNHVLDWGYRGLADTLATLRAAGIRTAGAGADAAEACAPAIIDIPGSRRVVVFSFGMDSAGVPRAWSAEAGRAGVCYLGDLASSTASAIASRIAHVKRPGDAVVVSIHWGGNWGYGVPRSQRAFARMLVENGADVVHGHSSHHAKGIEFHRGRPIFHGCGDFLNDYEGIEGYESFRSELGFMYFVTLGAPGTLATVKLVPTRIRRLRVDRARGEDAEWLAEMLAREGRSLGTRVVRHANDTLCVEPA
jgi:poly-gamma-glutamate synthesis protein (capsule biosynthesis protein)